ncbi:hypothetical protein LXL04_021048 [Taraxacum kok-saghyz]
MTDKTYVCKGYSTYTYIPDLQSVYDHEPKNLASQYAVETKTIEPVLGPLDGYGLNYENSSPSVFNNEGSLTLKTSNVSGSNEYQPLKTSTDNMKDSLGFLDSVNHFPRERGALGEISTSALSLEPQKRYAQPPFAAKPHGIYDNRQWWL